MKSILFKVFMLLYFLLLLVISFFSCSIFLKWPMYISGYSSLFTNHYNNRFVLLGLVLLTLSVFLYKKANQIKIVLFFNVLFASLFLGTQVTYTLFLLATAKKYDAEISFFRSFKGSASAAIADDTFTYLVFDGEKYDLDVYKPKKHERTKSTAVIFVHGGAFIEGNRSHVSYVADWFTDRGYTFFSISYPLATDSLHTWEMAANAVATSIGYVAAHAKQFDIDPNKIILAGGSAGGALVLQAELGLREGFVHAYDSLSVPRPKAVVSFYPPVSIRDLYKKVEEGKNIDLRHAAKKYLGGSPSAYPERYAQVNLIDQLSKGISPTIIVTGDIDHVVNVEATRLFVDTALQKKLPVTYVEIPYGEHVFDANPNSIASQIAWHQIGSFLQQQDLFVH